MSKKTTIINLLIEHITSVTASTGFRGIRFLNDINSFPAFYVHVNSERRTHKGAGVVYGTLAISLRGYQWSDSLDDIDSYARLLETAIQTFNVVEVQEARVISLRTDEGIMEPYGVVDLEVEILYTAIGK